MIMTIISLVIWIALSYLVAKYAGEHGLSFTVFLIVSLVFSPLISFIVALIVKKH